MQRATQKLTVVRLNFNVNLIKCHFFCTSHGIHNFLIFFYDYSGRFIVLPIPLRMRLNTTTRMFGHVPPRVMKPKRIPSKCCSAIGAQRTVYNQIPVLYRHKVKVPTMT